MGLLEEVISRDQELRGSGRWLHGDVNDSLVVDVEKQIFFWNSKNIVGDVYVYLRDVKGLNYLDAKEYLKNFPSYEGSFIHTIRNTEEVITYPKLVDIFYEYGLQTDISYWKDRGFTLETIHRFKLGFHDSGYFMIPVYQDGLFRNFQMRRDTPFKAIRSYYKGVGPLLFNSDILRITKEIIITEGPTDCIRLSQEGVPCVSTTIGADNWQAKWFKYFINQSKIIVIYDNDPAGVTGAIKVAKNLGLYRTKIYTFSEFEKGYDIIKFFQDNYSLYDLKKLLEEESKYAFELKEFGDEKKTGI